MTNAITPHQERKQARKQADDARRAQQAKQRKTK